MSGTKTSMQMHTLSSEPKTSASAAQAEDYMPARILEIELGELLPSVSAVDEKTGQRYQRAMCLVRLHTQPLGVVEFQLAEGSTSPYDYAQHIWCALGTQINEHLQQDNLPTVTGLAVAGLPGSGTPRCIKERERFLAQAPFVSVIVPTRDRPERVQLCLRSLLAQHYPRYEIIVVDNAPSTSATADFVQQTYRDEPRVNYVREDRPGRSWALNCGMMAAQGEILAFTDDDVVVDSYWLVELVRGFSRADDVACVTGLVLPLELETPAQFWIEEYGGFGKGFTRRIFDMAENHPKTPLYPYTAGRLGTGACMAFRMAFLRSVGGFDLALGAASPAQGGEDLAAFFQVVTSGYRLVYEPAALLYHPHRCDYMALRKQIYHYGVGLTAYLTKVLLDNPRHLFDLIPRLPYGLVFTLSTRSPKNSKKSTQYPKELTILELKGMLYGPSAYLYSRWMIRNVRKDFAPGSLRQ
jgi:GT2 family glycosyltransferase